MNSACSHLNPQRYRDYLCRECVREKNRIWMRQQQHYDEWFTKQRGMCAFCGLPMVYEDNATHLDHNHVTGVERGLVHAQCNQAVGGSELAIRLIGLPRLLDYLGIR